MKRATSCIFFFFSILLAFLCMPSGSLYAEDGQSEKNRLQKTIQRSLETGDVAKAAEAYNALSVLYGLEGNASASYIHLINSLKVREEFRDFISMSEWEHYMPLFYFHQKHPELLNRRLSGRPGPKDRISYAEAAISFNIIAGIYNWLGKSRESLEYHAKAIRIKKILDDRLGMAECHSMMGAVNESVKEYAAALLHFESELKLRKEIGDSTEILNSYRSIRTVCMLMQKYTRAEEVNMLVLQLAQRLDMKDAIASSYSFMSQLCRLSGNKACAIDAANKAWMIYHQDGNQLEEIMMLYNLSDLYLSLGRYGEAAAKGMKSLGQAEAIGFYPVRKDIYRVLSAAYDSMRNPGQALRFYKLGAQLNDSLYRDEKIRKMAKMDSIYQTERRQKEMELKESQLAKNEIEIKQQKTLTFSFMGGLALVLVFAMFVLYSLRKSAVKNRQLRAANAKIQRTTAELIESEKKAFISDLVAGLAHDLKTPVGNVMLSSDTIRYESDDISRLMSEKKLTQSRLEGFSKKVHESGDLIYAEMQRVSEWIKGFQSINADQVKTDSQNIHLCEYLRTCMKTLDFKLRSKKISYVVEGPQELKVKVMPGFISQVVINLINNAVEHGFEDLNRTDKTIWLKVSHDEGSGMVTCACGNNGRPIPEEIMPRIFNDYFSTKKSGIKGMGLSSVKRLVEQGLGGKIECHSAEGEGVTFTFEFPLHKPSEERT